MMRRHFMALAAFLMQTDPALPDAEDAADVVDLGLEAVVGVAVDGAIQSEIPDRIALHNRHPFAVDKLVNHHWSRRFNGVLSFAVTLAPARTFRAARSGGVSGGGLSPP
jgi:hypothetical protein